MTTFNNQERAKMTNPSTNDKTKGAIHQVKGAVKEAAGRAANNPDLEAEGTTEKLAGKFQKKVGQVERVLEK
jgi:uncharacterized protein YjbJ (UPF0337 family)